MQSEHLAEIVHAKFQVNAAIFVGAKPKKVGNMCERGALPES